MQWKTMQSSPSCPLIPKCGVRPAAGQSLRGWDPAPPASQGHVLEGCVQIPRASTFLVGIAGVSHPKSCFWPLKARICSTPYILIS